ncbi:MAG: hypothetical protein ACRETO_11430 [Gammaproteobacteria bacterium]
MSRVPLGKGMRVAVVRNGNNDSTTFAELQALIAAKADLSSLQYINGVPIGKIINANGTLNPAAIAQIYQSFLSESRKNRVPDSDIKFQSTYWTLSGLAITAAASPIGGNAFTFTGTGAASGNKSTLSDIIDVTPGETVCVSGYIDATHCTVNAPFWAIYSTDGLTQYAAASGVLGKAQRVSKKWVVSAGVTQVIVVAATNNATVANATKAIFSEPQFESGDQASSYMPNLANDGTGYLKAGATQIDLATPLVLNKTANNISYTAGGTVDSLMPAEANAAAALQGLTNIIPQPAPNSSNAITGWVAATATLTSSMYSTNTYAPVMGYFHLVLTTAGADVWASRNGIPIEFTASGGDKLYAEAELDVDTGITIELFASVLHADGSISSYVFFNDSTVTAWNLNIGTVTLPNDCVSYRLGFYISGTPGNSGSFTNVVVAHQSRGLTESLSGVQLGGQLNNVALNGGGYATSRWTGASMSGNGHCTVASGTLYLGGDSVSYNSATSGALSNGTTYHMYYQDAAYAGGTKTPLATTSLATLIASNANVYIGDFTPSTGGGSGVNHNCVTPRMFLRPQVPARIARSAIKIDTADGYKLTGVGKILNARIASGPALKLTASDGAILECGVDTPFTMPDGSSKLASDLVVGDHVLTDTGDCTLTEITDIGSQQLVYISAGGCSYAAGADAAKRIYSHNTLKP